MMTKKTKAILLSSMTLMLCVVLITTATFALYSQSTSVKYHLQAGKLELQLWRVGVAQLALNDQGYLVETECGEGDTTPSGKDVYQNFSGKVSDNLFGLSEKSLEALVPGSWFETTLKLVNNGDVAFRYNFSVDLGNSESSDLWGYITVALIPCDAQGQAIGEAVEKTLEQLKAEPTCLEQTFEANEAVRYMKIRLSVSKDATAFTGSGVNFDLVVTANQLVQAA